MASNTTVLTPPRRAPRHAILSATRKIQTSDGVPQEGQPHNRRVLKPCPPRPGDVSEKVASNLFPVVEYPQDFYSAEARFQTESETALACGKPGPLPMLLRNSRLYSFEPPTANSAFAAAVKTDGSVSRESCADWLAKVEYSPLAIALLDRMLRYHAWKHGLRFDEGHRLFYFTRSKPKTIWWEIDGRRIQQEVTAPRMIWTEVERGVKAEAQFGWRHRAIRAGFVQIQDALFLRLEPAWFMTELDGKTPATAKPVGPVDSRFTDQDISPEALRLIRFWSAVLTKGHRELRIPAGRNVIRVRIARIDGASRGGIHQNQMDSLALMNTGDEQRIPELVPLDL